MKKTAQNDVTGDWIQSKPNSDQFGEGWDRIFGKKKFECNTACGHHECNEHQGECKRLNKLPEYELNKSTGEVQKVEDGTTTNTQE